MRQVHAHQEAEAGPSTSTVNPDALRLMQLTKQYPKAAAQVIEKSKKIAATAARTAAAMDAAGGAHAPDTPTAANAAPVAADAPAAADPPAEEEAEALG
jgi:hypothetical protein